MPRIAANRTVTYEYELLSRFEAGIVLSGQEVRSAKTGHMSLKGAFVTVHDGALWLTHAFIPPYPQAGPLPHYDPYQSRKLLLHKSEIRHLTGKIKENGLTIVPIAVYTKGRHLKVECAVARGKKRHDKRETIRRREVDRTIRRAMKR